MWLFQNAKIQDLNVIHNDEPNPWNAKTVVSECKDTRFECNSQQETRNNQGYCVVSECKDTRFECNSQREFEVELQQSGCFRMQRYKI